MKCAVFAGPVCYFPTAETWRGLVLKQESISPGGEAPPLLMITLLELLRVGGGWVEFSIMIWDDVFNWTKLPIATYGVCYKVISVAVLYTDSTMFLTAYSCCSEKGIFDP